MERNNEDGLFNIPIIGNVSNLPITRADIRAGAKLSFVVKQSVDVNIKNISVGGNFFSQDMVIINGDSDLSFKQTLTNEQTEKLIIYYNEIPNIDKGGEIYINQSIRDASQSETFSDELIKAFLTRFIFIYNSLVDPATVRSEIEKRIAGTDKEIPEEVQKLIDLLTNLLLEREEALKQHEAAKAAEEAAKSDQLEESRKAFLVYFTQQLSELSDDFYSLLNEASANLKFTFNSECQSLFDSGEAMLKCDAKSRIINEINDNPYFPFRNEEDGIANGFQRVEIENVEYWVKTDENLDKFMTSNGPETYIGFPGVNAYNNVVYSKDMYIDLYDEYLRKAKFNNLLDFEPYEGGSDWSDSGLMSDMVQIFTNPYEDMRETNEEELQDQNRYASVINDRNASYALYKETVNDPLDSYGSVISAFAIEYYDEQIKNGESCFTDVQICPPQLDCDMAKSCCKKKNYTKEECESNGYEYGGENCDMVSTQCEQTNSTRSTCDMYAWLDYFAKNPQIMEDVNYVFNEANEVSYMIRMLFLFWLLKRLSNPSVNPINDPTISEPINRVSTCLGNPLRYNYDTEEFEFYTENGEVCTSIPLELIIDSIQIEYENNAEIYFDYYKEFRVENYISITSIQQAFATNTINISGYMYNVELNVNEEAEIVQNVEGIFEQIDRDMLDLPDWEVEATGEDSKSDSNSNSEEIAITIIIIILIVLTMVVIGFGIYIYVRDSNLSIQK